MQACVFVDGENFRYTINDLFAKSGYKKEEYLPKKANWEEFFDHLVDKANTREVNITRLRTYWYAINTVDAWPRLPTKREIEFTPQILDDWVTKNKNSIQSDKTLRNISLNAKLIEELLRRKKGIEGFFAGHRKIQRGISQHHRAIEFKTSGAISYDLFNRKLGQEKTVDVNLATDMLQMRNFYDIAIIVSGDQDYLPAVQAVKNSGKTVINVSFNDREGNLLPGGAKRLNETTDWSLTVDYETFASYMNLTKQSEKTNP